jgi:putative tryptophan/tyrosine transport system substrate-binding protein
VGLAVLVGPGILADCSLVPSRGTEPARPVRLGWLALAAPTGPVGQWFDAFLEGLRDYGYTEGHNLTIERRYADGDPGRLPTLAVELVALPVDVIFASAGTLAVTAARGATSTIPIVAATGDLVGSGLVSSLARPGGNVTGITNLGSELSGKRLELLTEAIPGVSRVALIHDPDSVALSTSLHDTQVAAGTLGITVEPLAARDTADLQAAFDVARERAQAVIIVGSPFLNRNLARIADLAARGRLPTMYSVREFADAGGLMAYAPNLSAQYRRAAYYVDRIVKGAKPADLPVEQPMRFDFVINLRTAQALDLTIPHHVLLQATEVLQ